MNKIINYKRLIAITNKLILNKKNNYEMFCIPFFHVIKGNDYHYRNYSFLFSKNVLIFFKNLFISFISVFIFIFKIFSKKFNYNNSSFFKKKYNYLFVSHIVNRKHLREKQDFQFGKVPFFYKKSTGMIYLNHISKLNSLDDLRLLNNFPLPIYILINQHCISNYFIILGRVLKQSFKILKFIKFKSSLLAIKVIIFGFIKSFDRSTFYNHVLFFEFFSLIKKTSPKFLIFTFEGQSYERVIIYAAKLANPKIKIIGYQNSPIIKNQNTFLLKFQSKFMPDEIWTSGSFCEKVIKNKLKIKTKILGSPKFIHQNMLNKNIYLNTSKKFTCLVAPEGVLSETYILFNFCLNYLKIHNNINFLWRLHPEISKEKLFNNFSFFNYNSNEVKFTNNKDTDFISSDLFLYRGTTLVTQAVKFGLRPLYLSLGQKDFNIDPLYKYQHIWKKTICTYHDLNKAVNEKFSNVDKLDFTKNLMEFSNTILQKVDYNIIKNLR
jgi:hypothetical protein